MLILKTFFNILSILNIVKNIFVSSRSKAQKKRILTLRRFSSPLSPYYSELSIQPIKLKLALVFRSLTLFYFFRINRYHDLLLTCE